MYRALSREQKESIGLLQIGTFLEYFDFMLYVHMAVLLNDLFFPKTDAHTGALLTAFAFCSTYVLRPFGALVFGYIGDTIGRKTTVIITTTMMAVSCIIMANLPTYAQIGVTATWVMTLCRLVQGMSSMGEIMGAMVYVAEITKPPVRYPAVSFISVASAVGGMAALGVATLVTRTGFNWRIAFWVGACIAVVGSVARTRLRETPEFLDMQQRRQNKLDDNGSTQKVSPKTLLCCFLIQCGWPVTFYMCFIYLSTFLQRAYDYTPQDVILHNFFLSIVLLVSAIFWARLSYRINPLVITRNRALVFMAMVLISPLLLNQMSHPYQVFALQTVFLIAHMGDSPANAILIKAIPVLKRFTATSFVYAVSRAVMYIITSFGLVYLTELFGHYGIILVVVPVCASFLWGVAYFSRLHEQSLQAA